MSDKKRGGRDQVYAGDWTTRPMGEVETEDMDWDMGDLESPVRKGPPPPPNKRPRIVQVAGPDGKPPGYLPGISRTDSPARKQRRQPPRREGATAGGSLMGFTAPDDRKDEAGSPFDSGRRQRMNRPTSTPFSSQGPEEYQSAGPMQQQAPIPGARSWNVTVPGSGVYRVEVPDNGDESAAKQALASWWQETEGQQLDMGKLTVAPSTEALARLREMINTRLTEIIRKKAGGGGYVLYSPNRGKKKTPKAVGEFPTRIAARKAELARFPPKDPEQLKRAREKMAKLDKDPKKKAEKEREDLTGRKKSKKTGSPARDRKKTKEALVQTLTAQLVERLFHDVEVPGSPWDERMSALHPDAIASDRKLHGLHKGIEKASIGALGDAHKGMSKALRGIAKVHPGDIDTHPELRKMYMPVHLDVKGEEVGPIHLYVDGGHVRVELSPDAREAIGKLEPPIARDLRGGLMAFQEDHLPRIDGARRAWDDRDEYLDKVHGKLDGTFGKMSDVELHLARQIMNGMRGRR